MIFDIVIKNGFILSPFKEPFVGDIGIKKDKIEFVGDLKESPSKDVIDATGLYVSPGFIDMHSHSDYIILKEKPFLGKIYQGITTEVIGNCGMSVAPYNQKSSPFLQGYKFCLGGFPHFSSLSWKRYLNLLKSSGLITNIVPLVGHGNIRTFVKGEVLSERLKEGELKNMKNLLREIMENGAFGFSTGLIYPPGIFTSTEEIIELCKVVHRYNGIYATHIRSEGENLIEAVKEAIKIAEKAEVSVQISHLKAMGRKNWKKLDKVLNLLYSTRRKGLNINYDIYPYTASSTTITVLFPSWMHQDGIEKFLERLKDKTLRNKIRKDILNDKSCEKFIKYGFQNILIQQVKSKKNRIFEGKSILEISKKLGKDPVEFLGDITLEEDGEISIEIFSMSEKNIQKLIREKTGFVGTDGLPGRRPHPRIYGTFPKIIRKYLKEERIISFKDMVYKFSKGPCEKLGLKVRGEIEVGKKADIVIFDMKRIKDNATYENPNRKPSGIKWVIINGKIVIENEKFTGSLAGKLLVKN